MEGQTGSYTITATNSGTAATSAPVTVTESLPGGLTVSSMSGTGWNCAPPTCSRSDSLSPGGSYPAITLTVNVSSTASGSLTNSVTISGGGAAPATANDAVTISGNCGTLATIATPAPGNISGGTATFTWNPACNAAQYYLYLGTAQGNNDILGATEGLSLTSGAVSIPSSGALWVRLWTQLGSSWQYNDYSYTIGGGGGGGGGCGLSATMTSPAPGTTLSASTVTFTWCNAGASQYYLYVGNQGVLSNNIYNGSVGTYLSQQVSGLPSTGTINVRIWSLVNGTWLFNDYTYTMNVATTVPITLTSSPSGMTLSVDGATCTTPCTQQWPAGVSRTITAGTQSGGTGIQYVFSTWADGVSSPSRTVTPTVATTYTANFNTQYFLTTSAAAGGTISPGPEWVDAGGVVAVSASASSGNQFTGFSGALTGTTTPQNLTMNGPATVYASFGQTVAAPTFTPPPGNYSAGQMVTLSTTTQGALIRYTDDGSTPPETAGKSYKGAIPVTSNTTIKAIAYQSQVDSNVSTGVYNITITGDFAIQASPSSQLAAIGQAATYTLNLIPISGFSGSIGLRVDPNSNVATC